ncbi:MAG: response regulator [Marinobacter sp.]
MVKEEVLIVDDSRSSLTWLSQLVSSAGYGVICVRDGREALALLETVQPDLILLDVDMPGMSGLELCSAIKQQKRFEHVPVLFQSVLTDSNIRIEGLKAGAADFLSKPYQPDEILLRVKIHLKLHALQTKLEVAVERRTQQLSMEIIQRQQVEKNLIESTQRLQSLTAHLQEIREEERKRIAREIHDELGQSLSLAQIELDRLSGIVGQEREEVVQLFNRLKSCLASSADTARSISENLRPGMLDLLGLKPALEHHIKTFEQATGLPCQIKIELNDDLELEDRHATAVFRIVQESLTNIAKHAQASRVGVSVLGNEEGLMVSVQDNGVGIEARSSHGRNAFGLQGMAERVEMLDGQLTTESLPGKGTRVEAFFPLGGKIHDD